MRNRKCKQEQYSRFNDFNKYYIKSDNIVIITID